MELGAVEGETTALVFSPCPRVTTLVSMLSLVFFGLIGSEQQFPMFVAGLDFLLRIELPVVAAGGPQGIAASAQPLATEKRERDYLMPGVFFASQVVSAGTGSSRIGNHLVLGTTLVTVNSNIEFY